MRQILKLLSLTLFLLITRQQILAIDFGTEYVKSALVNSGSGKAFSIVHNHKSDRKFLNSIGFYSEERYYESDSLSKRPRFPMNCFIFNKLLVDSVTHPELPSVVKKDLFMDYIVSETENHLVAEFMLDKFPEQTKEVTLIEVVAMLLKYAKHNAENEYKTKIKDVILTVPNFWNIKMRAFMIEAAQIADLYVLSLISENTGAALNYALNQRTKNTTEKILFYNLGSNYLQMTLAEFKQVPDEKSHKPIESIFILADFGVPYVGGLRFDQALFELFKQKFEKKYKKQMTKRGQIKLFHEANMVKETLSANKEAQIYVEGIMDGIDYSEKITRLQFEESVKELLATVTSPIKRFLFDNDLKGEELDGVELIGGGIRIPKLQNMIGDIIGNSSKIGQHINGDEAMVLGAAFYGANSSKKFKVKGVNLYDGFNFEIRAVIRNLEEDIAEDDDRYIFKNVTVFSKKSRFGLTKEINFKSKQNIIIELFQEDENGISLLRSDKLDNIDAMNEENFKVSLTLAIDPVEVVLVKKAQIKYKKEEIETYVQKVKKEPVKGEDKKEDEEKEKKEEEEKEKEEEEEKEKEASESDSEDEEKKSEGSEEGSDEEKEKEKEKPKKKKKKEPKIEYETVERNRTVTKKYHKDLHMEELFSQEKADHEEQELSRKLLSNYEKVEKEKRDLSESKNKLESLIYEVRDKLEAEDFLQFVQEKEKEKLEELLTEKSNWQDETYTDNKIDYDNQYKELNRPVSRIKNRIEEYEARENHYKKAQKVIEEYEELSKNITKKREWITEEQVNELFERIEEYKEEMKNMISSMRETEKNETPVFKIKDFAKVTEKTKDDYYKVMATPKPKKEAKTESKEEKEEAEADESQEL